MTTAAADRALYLDYLEHNGQAGVCVERLPQFNEQLAPVLRKWRVRHETRLRVGDAFIHAEAARDQITIEEKMEQVTRAAVAKFQALPEAELAGACGKIVDWFEGKDDKKTADKAGAKTPAANAPQPPA